MLKKNGDSTTENIPSVRKPVPDKLLTSKSVQQTVPQIVMAPSTHKVSNNVPQPPQAPANLYRIEPRTLNFYGNTLSSQTITVQNVGRDPLKLFLSTPKTIYFSLG